MPDGTWGYDYAFPDPDPSPFTTIAWRISHIATCKVMYHEYGFGPAKLTFPDLLVPRSVPESVAMLHQGQAMLMEDLARLQDGGLKEPRRTNRGEMWPTWRILWTMINHDLWHGGEIGVLRDLYRVAPGVAVTVTSPSQIEEETMQASVSGDLRVEGRSQ